MAHRIYDRIFMKAILLYFIIALCGGLLMPIRIFEISSENTATISRPNEDKDLERALSKSFQDCFSGVNRNLYIFFSLLGKFMELSQLNFDCLSLIYQFRTRLKIRKLNFRAKNHLEEKKKAKGSRIRVDNCFMKDICSIKREQSPIRRLEHKQVSI